MIGLRNVKPSDAKEYIELENFIYRKTYQEILSEELIKQREEKTNDRIDSFDKTHINDNKNICVVAEEEKLIGYVWGVIKSETDFFRKDDYADLVALYVHPDYQGKGVGKMLKNAFIVWAKNCGAKKFVIGVLKDNLKARKVYEKWGGKLSDFTSKYMGYDEVFYTYDIE